MITIRPPQPFDAERFQTLAGGYTTSEIYHVARRDSDEVSIIALTLTPLPAPRSYSFPYSAEELARYAQLVNGPFALGAYDGEAWVGVALGERRDWNRTVWLHEFHVDPAYQRRGIGRRLIDELAARAAAAGLRALVLEAQNTNVPAIRFYRRVGFTLDGLHVSTYTNDDLRPDRSVALFMTRRLE